MTLRVHEPCRVCSKTAVFDAIGPLDWTYRSTSLQKKRYRSPLEVRTWRSERFPDRPGVTIGWRGNSHLHVRNPAALSLSCNVLFRLRNPSQALAGSLLTAQSAAGSGRFSSDCAIGRRLGSIWLQNGPSPGSRTGTRGENRQNRPQPPQDCPVTPSCRTPSRVSVPTWENILTSSRVPVPT